VASLAARGFLVNEAAEGGVFGALLERPAALVLLDLNLPERTGLDTCRQIRAYAPRIGIVILADSPSADHTVEALETGADDCVAQPIQPCELIARLRAIHRRFKQIAAPRHGFYRAGQLELDLGSRRFSKAGVEIRLTPKEFDLLAVLMQNLGIQMTHRKLLQTVWGPDYGTETEYLRSYVKMLRRKIEDDPRQPRYLVTQPWSGYRLQSPPAREAIAD
jgi:two-component system KDP operon response regulator KdpE